MERLSVLKTYKLYIGGAFPRTESGRYFKVTDKTDRVIANLCTASRKDFRNAVVAARKAQSSWSGRTAYNRSQILYRIAEMAEGRSEQLIHELKSIGFSPAKAKTEVMETIDRFIYYAGWCDKYQQISGAVNPVASSHFNFSVPEPTGVVSIIGSEEHPLLGMATEVSAAIASGNTAIYLAPNKAGLPAMSFAEIIHTSDVPGGVINILTGDVDELKSHFSSHMDVNALVICDANKSNWKEEMNAAAENVKRVVFRSKDYVKGGKSLSHITDLCEIKTTWHPIGA
jgi:acyl-CoA reductase-like NAD-dependent aldehyde dehydrogenase